MSKAEQNCETQSAEQNCETQSGPKHRKKSSDLRRCLKTVSDVDEVTLDANSSKHVILLLQSQYFPTRLVAVVFLTCHHHRSGMSEKPLPPTELESPGIITTPLATSVLNNSLFSLCYAHVHTV